MSHTTEKNLDAVTARLRNNKIKGKQLYQLGIDLLTSKPSVAAFRRYEDAAYYFFLSHLSYKACSRWRPAGDSLVQLAKVYTLMKEPLESATVYTMASEVYMRIDKSEGLKALRSAINIYCDLGRFDIAGRLEQQVAELHYINKHWEEASTHFEKAANFVAGEQLFEQSDLYLEKAAGCYVEVGEYMEAQRLFETIARSSVQSNLRKFNARDFLFRACLCSLAMPVHVPKLKDGITVDISHPIDGEHKYEKVFQKIFYYETIDPLFRGSSEQKFLLNIYQFRLDWNLDSLADHMYCWNNVRPLDRWCLLMIQVVANEVKNELSRRDAVIQREIEREEARKKRKEAKQMAKLLEQMGGAGGAGTAAGDTVPHDGDLDSPRGSETSDPLPSGEHDDDGENAHGEHEDAEGSHRKTDDEEMVVFEGDDDDDDVV